MKTWTRSVNVWGVWANFALIPAGYIINGQRVRAHWQVNGKNYAWWNLMGVVRYWRELR